MKSRVIGTPCADCGTPITEEMAVWRSGRVNSLLSYCRPCYRLRANATGRKNRHVGRAAQRRYYNGLREQILVGYGAACACCGESHREFLALDHVNGGGTRHRAKVKQSGIYLDAVKRGFPSDYRLLCHNCNQAFGAYGYCPHETERSDANAQSL